MPILIIFFLIFCFSFKNLYSKDEYFLTLRNEKVNLRQGPSFDYPIKLFATKIGKIKSKFFKKVYINKVNQTIYNFKHNYPFKLMKKIFIRNEKNLENIYRNLISLKIDE